MPIDSVRSITNMSSGKFGAEIAARFLESKNEVLFFYAKNSKRPLNSFKESETCDWEDTKNLSEFPYEDYDEYLEKSISLIKLTKPDIIISAAAVSDYTVDKAEGKLSSNDEELIIRLKKAAKVLPLLKEASPNSMIVGFKLLVKPTYDQVFKAVQKVLNNGADYVIYNDLAEIKKGNSARLIFKKDMTFVKVSDAKQLVQYISNEYSTWPNGQRSDYGCA